MIKSHIVSRVDGYKTVLTIPWTVDQLQYGAALKTLVQNGTDAFKKVPLVYRALRVRCNGLLRIPLYVYDGDKEVNASDYPFNSSVPLKSLIWLSEAALLFEGKAAWVKLVSADGGALGLQYVLPYTLGWEKRINPQTMQPMVVYYQMLQGKRYPQLQPYWTRDELFMMEDFDPSADIAGGVGAIPVALQAAQLKHYVLRFASQFFESGAMPITMIMLPENTDKPEAQRVEGFFKKAMQGVRNAFRVIAVNSTTQPKTLTPDIKSMALDEIRQEAIDDVCWAFDVPKTVLTAESANYATAETEMKSFIEYTLAPRASMIEDHVNRLLEPLGWHIEFAPNEMHEMQRDEKDKAVAFNNYVDGGMSPQLAAVVCGVDIPPDFEKEFFTTTQRKQKPEEGGDADVADLVPPEMKAELSRWRRKAIMRFRRAHKAQVDFESDRIPAGTQKLIYQGLAAVKSEMEIRNLFNNVKVCGTLIPLQVKA